ncbi:MAG: right-handed parallel beta-helix repeat-containing protein [Candidatus Thorarchaeota archaeon]
MKKNFKIVLILILFIATFTYNRTNDICKAYEPIPSSFYGGILEGEINIASDNDLFDYSLNGTGTQENPYVIENQKINSETKGGIFISSTTKYITIRNCTIYSKQYGIYIVNVLNNTVSVIDNLFVVTTGVGIYLKDIIGVEISKNQCINSTRGIEVVSSKNLVIVNNNCSSNHHYGMLIINVNNSIIRKNYCINNLRYRNDYFHGIFVFQSYTLEIIKNTCHNIISDEPGSLCSGIYIVESEYCVAIENDCSFNKHYGFYILDSDYIILYNNTLEHNLKGIVISSGIEITSAIAVVYNKIISNIEHGIVVYQDARKCYFHHNIILNNNINENEDYSQSIDDNGKKNFWYDKQSKIGNFWSNWNLTRSYKISSNNKLIKNKDPFPIIDLSKMEIPDIPDFPEGLKISDKAIQKIEMSLIILSIIYVLLIIVFIHKMLKRIIYLIKKQIENSEDLNLIQKTVCILQALFFVVLITLAIIVVFVLPLISF